MKHRDILSLVLQVHLVEAADGVSHSMYFGTKNERVFNFAFTLTVKSKPYNPSARVYRRSPTHSRHVCVARDGAHINDGCML